MYDGSNNSIQNRISKTKYNAINGIRWQQVQWNEISKNRINIELAHSPFFFCVVVPKLLLLWCVAVETVYFLFIFFLFLLMGQRRFPSINDNSTRLSSSHSHIFLTLAASALLIISAYKTHNITEQTMAIPTNQPNKKYKLFEKKFYLSHLIPEIWAVCSTLFVRNSFGSKSFSFWHFTQRTKNTQNYITFIVYWVVRELMVQHYVVFCILGLLCVCGLICFFCVCAKIRICNKFEIKTWRKKHKHTHNDDITLKQFQEWDFGEMKLYWYCIRRMDLYVYAKIKIAQNWTTKPSLWLTSIALNFWLFPQ